MDFLHGGSESGEEYQHSADQIQRLEEFFKENPHPDDSQRQHLSKELGLDRSQIKLWFQNKRTQTKTQNEKAGNDALRPENKRPFHENHAMQDTLKSMLCPACYDSGLVQDDKLLNLYLRRENARLKEEYERKVASFANSEKPTSAYRLSEIQEMDRSTIIETAIPPVDELTELLLVKEPHGSSPQ